MTSDNLSAKVALELNFLGIPTVFLNFGQDQILNLGITEMGMGSDITLSINIYCYRIT